MQIIVGLKCKEVSEKGCLLSLLCHLFIIYFLFLNQRDSHENRTIFVNRSYEKSVFYWK